MTELTDEEAMVMAAECPIVRAAYASGDDDVIKRTEAMHPASRCEYVKAYEKERGK